MAQATAQAFHGITHLVVLNEDNEPVLVLCHKVRPSKLIPGTLTQDRPSCAPCARLWDQGRK